MRLDEDIKGLSAFLASLDLDSLSKLSSVSNKYTVSLSTVSCETCEHDCGVGSNDVFRQHRCCVE